MTNREMFQTIDQIKRELHVVERALLELHPTTFDGAGGASLSKVPNRDGVHLCHEAKWFVECPAEEVLELVDALDVFVVDVKRDAERLKHNAQVCLKKVTDVVSSLTCFPAEECRAESQ